MHCVARPMRTGHPGTPSSSLASHAGGGRSSYAGLAMQGEARASIERNIASLVPLAKLVLGAPSGYPYAQGEMSLNFHKLCIWGNALRYCSKGFALFRGFARQEV